MWVLHSIINTTFVGTVTHLTAHMLRFGVEQLKQIAQFSGVKITTGGCFFY